MTRYYRRLSGQPLRPNPSRWNPIDGAFVLVSHATDLPLPTWRFCRRADAEHARSPRQFCHVDCAPGQICFARAAEGLPAANLIGLIAHELGHLLAGDDPDEDLADALGGEAIGAEILYDEDAVQTVGSGVDRATALRRYQASNRKNRRRSRG